MTMIEIGQALRDIINRVSTVVVTITLDMSGEIVCHNVTMQPADDQELRHQIGHMVSDRGTVLDQSVMTAMVTVNRAGERSVTGIAADVEVEIKRLCQEAADRYFQKLGPFVNIQTYITLARQCLQEFRTQSRVPTAILLESSKTVCCCPCGPCAEQIQGGPNIIIPGPYHVLEKSVRVPLCMALASAFRAMLIEMIEEVPAEQVASPREPPAPHPPDRPATEAAGTPAVDSVRDDLEYLEKLRAQSGFESMDYVPPDEQHTSVN